jgi:DNA-binding CsgD family transcriptional regulator/tetratricopeptide (TPR) repeat protein
MVHLSNPCQRLEGIPLAIERAAGRIGVLSAEQLSKRLDDHLKLLRRGSRTSEPRQRSMRATLEWSHELLSEPERVLFRRLSGFAGGWTLEAAEEVCSGESIEEGDVMDLPSELVESSLVVAGAGHEEAPRFRMLEPIRQYGQERLQDESGEAETTKRTHAEYFLALAEQAEPKLWGAEDALWLDRLEREHDNMRAALSWSMEQDEVELALKLGGALRWFWYVAGYYSEGRSWLEAALGKEGPASAEARIKALAGVGWLTVDQGDLDRAEAAAEEGLKLSTQAGIRSAYVADFKNLLGGIARGRGDLERSARLVKESLALHREAGNKPGIAWTLHTLATVYGARDDRDDHEQAKRLYEEGLALSRLLGGARQLVDYLVSLGYTLLLEGDLERATTLNEVAAMLARERGYKGGLEYILDNRGWAALLQGDHQRAKTSFEESLMVCKELGDKITASESLEGLACIAGANGDAERSARLFGAAEVLREAVGYQQEPRQSALREPYLEAARSRLTEAAWEKAFIEGRTMGMEEAVEYAFAKEEKTDPLATPAPEEPSTGQAPVVLTHREKEVAAMVAQGMSNRQIARELSISEHTAANHVHKILKKLELRSRAQIGSR